jgi:hypothetical protein
MGVVDIIIATAVFSFFFFYAIFFINSIQVEFRAPTSTITDRIFENLKTNVLIIPVKIKSNYTLKEEVIELKFDYIDKNSTIVKIDGQIIPSQFLDNELVFPFNYSSQLVYVYFINESNRTRANYSTDLSFSEFAQYFKINNSFYDSNLQKNCSWTTLSSNNFNVFENGIILNEIVNEKLIDNVAIKIACGNISYKFFSYSPRIEIMTKKNIAINLKPNFTNWETELENGTISSDVNLITKKLILYNTSSKLIFFEFDNTTNITIHPGTTLISLIINEPSNFSIYVTNFSTENKAYFKNRSIFITIGAIEKNIALTNESISNFMNEEYNILKNKFGYNFFVEVSVNENIIALKGEYLSEVKRISERDIFYYDNNYSKNLTKVRIGIW